MPYQDISRLFSRAERAMLAIFLSIALITSTFVINDALFSHQRVQSLASRGDTLTIGHIGTTETLNSLYCTNSMTIRTACSLVFRGLYSIDPFTHELKPELASSLEVSSDLKTYTVKLRKARFHDDVAISSNDILFTYNTLLKDPSYDGPYKGAFNGVKIVAKDTETVEFILDEANTFFPYSLIIGILPQHVLTDVQSVSDLLSHSVNHNPIGTGPYQVQSINKSANSSEIKLKAYDNYYGEKPYLENITITGFSSLENLEQDKQNFDVVYADNLDTINMHTDYIAHQFSLPQYIGLFFNTTSATFSNKSIRLGLKVGTDRNKVISELTDSTIIDSPFPDILTQKITYNLEKAKTLLAGAKVTPDTPKEIKLVFRKDAALEKAAQEIARQWKELGINCILISQEFGELQNNFLKTRNYDALLIGERMGANIDLYPYFHSSQGKYPGLNFSVYKNVVVDNLLNKVRLTIDSQEQRKLLNQAYDKILEDMPFLPLYTNQSKFFINKRVHNTFIPSFPVSPEQLYALIKEWYIAEKQIWI